jgi:hypothetical protein
MRTCTPQQSHSMGNGGASEALTYARKGVAVNPKVLRQYAVDCDRMAKECSDLFTKEALIELAVEFHRASEETKAVPEPGEGASRRPGPALPWLEERGSSLALQRAEDAVFRRRADSGTVLGCVRGEPGSRMGHGFLPRWCPQLSV